MLNGRPVSSPIEGKSAVDCAVCDVRRGGVKNGNTCSVAHPLIVECHALGDRLSVDNFMSEHVLEIDCQIWC